MTFRNLFATKSRRASAKPTRPAGINKARISHPVACRSSLDFDVGYVAEPRPHPLSNYSAYLDYTSYSDDEPQDDVLPTERTHSLLSDLDAFEVEADKTTSDNLRRVGI